MNQECNLSTRNNPLFLLCSLHFSLHFPLHFSLHFSLHFFSCESGPWYKFTHICWHFPSQCEHTIPAVCMTRVGVGLNLLILMTNGQKKIFTVDLVPAIQVTTSKDFDGLQLRQVENILYTWNLEWLYLLDETGNHKSNVENETSWIWATAWKIH